MAKLLYIIDDINYLSGAREVTLCQIKYLSAIHDISILTLRKPSEEEIEKTGLLFLDEIIWKKNKLLTCSLKTVLKSKKVSLYKKCERILYTLLAQIGCEDIYIKKNIINHKLKEKIETYDIVIVMSEASKLRKFVSTLKHPKKIQWIHTDYVLWSQYNNWTKKITKKDYKLYKKYDFIILLSEQLKKKFCKKYPQLSKKTIKIPNLINGEEILKKAQEEIKIKVNSKKLNLITIGRLEPEKSPLRILKMANYLKKQNVVFCWYLVGEGSQKEYLSREIKKEKLEQELILLGEQKNPYPLMKQCDWLILLSDYEGTPVTIDEAKVLGVSVLAKDVGGISEQLDKEQYGKLLNGIQNEDMILNEIVKKENIGKSKLKFLYDKYNEEILHDLDLLLKNI